MPDALDFAELRLDAFETAGKLRVDLIKAYANYNETMSKVAERQVKVALDKEELRMLRTARREFARALRDVRKDAARAERAVERLRKKSQAAARLEWGELLEPNLLSPAWAGLFYLVKQMPGADRRQVMRIKVSAKHRRGTYFVQSRHPNSDCDDASSRIKTALGLFGWAQKHRCLPRNGSPPQEKLFDVFDAVDAAAQKQIQTLLDELTRVRSELLELRKMNWKAVQLAEFSPKR